MNSSNKSITSKGNRRSKLRGCFGRYIFVQYSTFINTGKWCVKEGLEKVKSEINSKISFWNNVKSRKVKAGLIVLFIGIVCLKIYTTVFTFDWFTNLIQSL